MSTTDNTQQLANSVAKALRDHAVVPPLAVDTKTASHMTGYSVETLEKMRTQGGGPPFVKHRKRVVYRVEALEQWLKANEHANTSDTGGAR